MYGSKLLVHDEVLFCIEGETHLFVNIFGYDYISGGGVFNNCTIRSILCPSPFPKGENIEDNIVPSNDLARWVMMVFREG